MRIFLSEQPFVKKCFNSILELSLTEELIRQGSSIRRLSTLKLFKVLGLGVGHGRRFVRPGAAFESKMRRRQLLAAVYCW